jgi:hypothetical protein
LFSPVGLSFGKEEACLINCALKRLAEDKNADKLRFWGKILTQTQDYYIAQGFTKDTNSDPPTGDMEKVKEGVNYHVYWVTQNICNYLSI